MAPILHHRFIPACAGNSYQDTVNIKLEAVHPRVCGEQLSGFNRIVVIVGSSPRVRGTGYHPVSHH